MGPGLRRCPSSLYTFPSGVFRTGLARDCHLTGFPEFEQFYIASFPAEHSRLAQVRCVYQFRHARNSALYSGGPGGPLELIFGRRVRLLAAIAPGRPGTFAPDIDRGNVERCADMHRVVFFNHLDAGAAVLGYLVDVGTFHEAQADIGVA